MELVFGFTLGRRRSTAPWGSVLAGSMLVALLACGRAAGPGATQVPAPTWQLDGGPLSPEAKVFLVAGGNDIANFGAEIVVQRRMWRSAGLREDEIVCYFAPPTEAAYAEDRAQYDRLSGGLVDCRPATAERLLADLAAAADRAPPWIYLYVTSHGIDSLRRMVEQTPRSRRILDRLTNEELALLDRPVIGLDAPPGPRLQAPGEVIAGHRAGRPPAALMLSPDTLTDALRRFPAETLKVVVLQACYSGGFLPMPEAPDRLDRQDMADVPNVVAMSAAAADRPSFGCGAGDDYTYFGAAVNAGLRERLRPGVSALDIDWAALFSRANFAITVMELVESERPSRPRFFTNVPTPE